MGAWKAKATGSTSAGAQSKKKPGGFGGKLRGKLAKAASQYVL